MPKGLEDRIEKLEGVYDKLHANDTKMVSGHSYLYLLKLHIRLLEEMNDLCEAIIDKDEKAFRKFVNKRCGTD